GWARRRQGFAPLSSPPSPARLIAPYANCPVPSPWGAAAKRAVALALARVDPWAALVSKVLFCILLALLTAIAIDKSAGYAAAMSVNHVPRPLLEAAPPPRDPLDDGAMNVDLPPPDSPSPSSVPQALPFPGTVVDGVQPVVHLDISNLRRGGLRDLCETYKLPKTGNMATLTERLQAFSADRKAWDGILAGARNKHRGPRDGGVTKEPKKKASTKLSTLRREQLFGANTDSTGSTTGPYLPTERSKDMRTEAEKKALLAWADRGVERNSHHGPTHPLYKPPPPGATDTTAHADGCTGNNTPALPVGEKPDLAEELRLLHIKFASLMTMVASGNFNGASVAPSPSSDVAAGVDAITTPSPVAAATAVEGGVVPASRGNGVDGASDDCPAPSMAMPSRLAASPEQPAGLVAASAADPGPLRTITLGNGKTLSFSKLSVPDPPSISFARDLSQLMRIWDDTADVWTPRRQCCASKGSPLRSSIGKTCIAMVSPASGRARKRTGPIGR
ncbi:hypothetical protein EI94DRAFT_1855058, partial [Lactarius quietus]